MGSILVHDDGDVLHRLGTEPFRHLELTTLPVDLDDEMRLEKERPQLHQYM